MYHVPPAYGVYDLSCDVEYTHTTHFWDSIYIAIQSYVEDLQNVDETNYNKILIYNIHNYDEINI